MSERKLENDLNKTNYEIFINLDHSGLLSECWIVNEEVDDGFEVDYYKSKELESYDINDFKGGQILEIPSLSNFIELDNGKKLKFTIINVRVKVADADFDPTWE